MDHIQSTASQSSNLVIQPTPPRHTSSIRRQDSTKALISHFEELVPPPLPPKPKPTSTQPDVRSETTTIIPNVPPLVPSRLGRVATLIAPKSGEGTLPIRQSIRNFLTIFTSRKSLSAGGESRTASYTNSISHSLPNHNPSSATAPIVSTTTKKQEVEAPRLSAPPPPLRRQSQIPSYTSSVYPASTRYPVSCEAYYLVRPGRPINKAHSPLIWAPCSLKLDPGELVLSFQLSEHETAGKIVPIASCADVRSVCASDLPKDVKVALPGDEYKVFELIFDDRESEFFAVTSVSARTRWVNIIWKEIEEIQQTDSLPLASGPQRTSPKTNDFMVESTASGSSCISSIHSLLVEPAFADTYDQIHSPTPSSLDVLSLEGPSTLDSSQRSITHTRPSVRDLGRRNVVSQRIAQLHTRTNSLSSTMPYSRPSRPPSLQLPTFNSVEGDTDSILHSYYSPLPSPTSEGQSPTTSATVVSQAPSSISHKEHREATVSNLPSTRVDLQHVDKTETHTHIINVSERVQRAHRELLAAVQHADSSNVQNHALTRQAGEAQLRELHVVRDGMASLLRHVKRGKGLENSIMEVARGVGESRRAAREDIGVVLKEIGGIKRVIGGDLTRPGRTILGDLDELRSSVSSYPNAGGVCAGDELAKVSKKLDQVFVQIQENRADHVHHSGQQADCIRYLSELNTWMESLVNHTKTQNSAILAELRQVSTSNNTNGQPSISNTLEYLRQEQSQMFLSLAAEIREHINGERLRFVDAMKEATAINVQRHVEQLKQELARETTLVMNEVARLQYERFTLEQHVTGLRKQDARSAMLSPGGMRRY